MTEVQVHATGDPGAPGPGHASACVEHLSRRIQRDGHTAILYTPLSNPTANAIYRRIGYRPVLEVLSYDFDEPKRSSSP